MSNLEFVEKYIFAIEFENVGNDFMHVVTLKL